MVYEPDSQSAVEGELRALRDGIQEWKTQLGLQKASAFLTGMSAGAAMAAGLLACYPNEFAAGAMHSGTPYASAKNAMDAMLAQKVGPRYARAERSQACDPRSFAGPAMVIQGAPPLGRRSPWTGAAEADGRNFQARFF